MSDNAKDNNNSLTELDENILNEVSGGINHGGFIDNILKIFKPSDESEIKTKKD